jgi:hypothetical protein
MVQHKGEVGCHVLLSAHIDGIETFYEYSHRDYVFIDCYWLGLIAFLIADGLDVVDHCRDEILED